MLVDFQLSKVFLGQISFYMILVFFPWNVEQSVNGLITVAAKEFLIGVQW